MKEKEKRIEKEEEKRIENTHNNTTADASLFPSRNNVSKTK